jgi:hypothetical protein
MSQHFLLSAAARSLSLTRIMRMTDDDAHDTFKRIPWAATAGEPFCPHCGCLTVYTLAETPPRWKCSGCRRKFSLTSQTLFHSRKLPVRDYLAIIALFVNGVKGIHADESNAWERLHASYDVRRVNHSVEYKAEDGANVNQAESYFSRLRRAEIGQHHRISGHLLHQYANEAAWREDNRRKPNGTNWSTVIGAALTGRKSPVWAGYWHRSAA